MRSPVLYLEHSQESFIGNSVDRVGTSNEFCVLFQPVSTLFVTVFQELQFAVAFTGLEKKKRATRLALLRNYGRRPNPASVSIRAVHRLLGACAAERFQAIMTTACGRSRARSVDMECRISSAAQTPSSPWQKSRGPRYGQTGPNSRRRRSADPKSRRGAGPKPRRRDNALSLGGVGDNEDGPVSP